MLRGHEAELADGAKGDVSLKILGLFSEVKRIQNELPIDEEQNNQLVCTIDEFVSKNEYIEYFIFLVSSKSIRETIHITTEWKNSI